MQRVALKAQKPSFKLLGISSADPMTRLCWSLNKKLQLQLSRDKDLIITHPRKKEKQVFALFTDQKNHYAVSYAFIDNKSESGWFLEEYKNIDYLFQVLGEMSPAAERKLIQDIKATEGVYGVFALDPGRLKNASKLDLL